LLPDIYTENEKTKLRKIGITSLFDLFLYLPTRYQDRTKVDQIKDLNKDKYHQIEGEVSFVNASYRPRKNLIVVINDATGTLQLRFLNFYPSQIKQFTLGKKIRAYGIVKEQSFIKEMIHPEYEIIQKDKILPQHLTAVYPLVSGVTQKAVFKLVKKAFKFITEKNSIIDYFYELNKQRNLPDLIDSIKMLHMPDKKSIINNDIYLNKLAYDELLAHQLFFRGLYHQKKNFLAKPITKDESIYNLFISSLPFELTNMQKKTYLEIMKDLQQTSPMNRLLQGDVGCGKTIVATLAAIQIIKNGYQAALMAPTEILAEQHYNNLKKWLDPLKISVGFLSGSISKKEKLFVTEMVMQGNIDLLVGTHALIQDNVRFKSLALYIIDEQHRFGVEQRLSIRTKNKIDKKYQAHQLMMSATPIPRTLSMSYFADMDISTINELPPGRQKITTKLIADSRRTEFLSIIQSHCKEGNQVYWVCPLIEESEKLQLETVENTFKKITSSFASLTVGLIHGKMKSKEKESIMHKFKTGDLQILVATTVIEVGVDVPNATMIIIENAERMGLSQLHQLRGRVGRGAKESTCILLYGKKLSNIAKDRLKVIYENLDGFKISEEDLRLRGPGEFLGLKQSGLPALKIADINKDKTLLDMAKEDAEDLINKKHNKIESHLQRWISNYQEITRT
jgi:ATP-dependent DNA helicase RecG